MKNVVGFYSTRQQADQVKDDLIKSGVDRDDITVYDREGKHEASLWEDIKSAFGFADDDDRELYTEAARRGAVAGGVSFDRDDEPATIIQIMQRHNPINLATQADQWRKEGWTGRTAAAGTTTGVAAGAARTTTSAAAATRPATSATAAASAQRVQQGTETVPVVEEQLQVGKRAVQSGGVRVHTRVIEKPVQEQVNLREEHVHVERHPVDRPLTAADKPFQERVIEATETVEQPVVAKQARVVEEVNVRKDVNQRTETVRDTVRRTDVQVEQIDTDPKYAPARDFATRFFSDNRYKGRSWDEVEPDARRSFEQSYPGKWSEFRDVIRSRYDRDTSKSKSRANA
jgi:uncharacterized protein (TIGR02271 family)